MAMAIAAPNPNAQTARAVFPLINEEVQAIEALKDDFRLGITPYYLDLMDPTDPTCPIRRHNIPLLAEQRYQTGSPDPLAEERDMPVMGVTNRYPNEHCCGHTLVPSIVDIVQEGEKLEIPPVIRINLDWSQPLPTQ